MRSVVTVLGKDRVGIIAEVSRVFYLASVNIDGMNQGIIDGLFTMTMVVDMKDMNMSFESLQEFLSQVAQTLDMDIRIQKEEIFLSMHRI